MMETTYTRLGIGLIILFTIFIVIAGLFGGNDKECTLGSKVAKVGGCDAQGSCGVIYTDGYKGTLYYPVVGELCRAEQ